MSTPTGKLTVAKTNGEVFTNSIADDFLITTEGNGSNICIGPKNSTKAPIVVGSNVVQISSHIVPTSNVAYDLGTPEMRFRDIWMSGSTIHMGDISLSSTPTTGLKVIDQASGELVPVQASEVQLKTPDGSIVKMAVDNGGSIQVTTSNEQGVNPVTIGASVQASNVESGNFKNATYNFPGTLTASNLRANFVNMSNVSLSNLTVSGISTFSNATVFTAPAPFNTFNNGFISGGFSTFSNVRTSNIMVATLSNGHIIFGNSTNNLVSNSNIFWDNVNNRLGVGTNAPQYPIQVVGQFNNISIHASHDIAGFSDMRLKDNFEVIPNALEKVMQIRGYTFTRLDSVDKNLRSAGVIAQEVQKVLPEVVYPSETGYLSVAYGNMVSLLIEAVRELNQKMDALAAK